MINTEEEVYPRRTIDANSKNMSPDGLKWPGKLLYTPISKLNLT